MKRAFSIWGILGLSVAFLLSLVISYLQLRGRDSRPRHTSSAPLPNNVETSRIKEVSHKPVLSVTPQKIEELFAAALQHSGIQDIVHNWQGEERKSATFVQRRLANGRQVIVVLQPVTEAAENRLKRNLQAALSAALTNASPVEIKQVENRLYEWFALHRHERILEINYIESLNQSQAFLDGTWFDVGDAQSIKDHVHYVDYGHIIDSGSLDTQTLQNRYGALFSIAEKNEE